MISITLRQGFKRNILHNSAFTKTLSSHLLAEQLFNILTYKKQYNEGREHNKMDTLQEYIKNMSEYKPKKL